MDKDKLTFLKMINIMCKVFKFISMITICTFLIPIIMIFEINMYDMETLAILFTLLSIATFGYYSTINKITLGLLDDTDKKSIDKFTAFSHISSPDVIDIIIFIFLGMSYIAYYVCLVIADCPDLTKMLYFIITIIPMIGILKSINSYLNNSYKLSKIIRKYYDEILAS